MDCQREAAASVAPPFALAESGCLRHRIAIAIAIGGQFMRLGHRQFGWSGRPPLVAEHVMLGLTIALWGVCSYGIANHLL